MLEKELHICGYVEAVVEAVVPISVLLVEYTFKRGHQAHVMENSKPGTRSLA